MEPSQPRTAKLTSSLIPGKREATIEHILIRGLFGQYDYDIPKPAANLGRLSIFYGDNGLGKTNVLKILFHLLSPSSDRGHRTALSKISFSSVEVRLSSGVVVSANRSAEKRVGGYRAEVRMLTNAESVLLGAWDWVPDGEARENASRFPQIATADLLKSLQSTRQSPKERSKLLQSVFVQYLEKEVSPVEGEEAFLAALAAQAPSLFFLSADRIFSSDKVQRDNSPYYDADIRAGARTETLLTKGRERALNDAINSASRQLSRLAARRSRQGSTSMHGIYHGLIRRLASRATPTEARRGRTIASLKRDVEHLSAEYQRFSKYGLTPILDFNSLMGQLDKVRVQDRPMASEVLTPYVESLTEQAKMLGPAYSVIDGFMSTINQFLYDKEATFTLGEGMVVKSRTGEILHPKDLSSGEQQILLLFCTIAIVYESGGVFIVDEPEISLNIKWQRKLVDALLRLDIEGTLQFILASHSLEVITPHRESVVTLVDKKNG